MFQNPIYTYIGFALAVIAIVLGVIEPAYSTIAWTIAAVFGFGSASLARKFIDSKGWVTHTIGIVVGGLVILQLLGVITPDQFQGLMVAFAPLTGIGMVKALGNSPSSSFPKLGGKIGPL